MKFLARLAARSAGLAAPIRPRLPSPFETPPADVAPPPEPIAPPNIETRAPAVEETQQRITRVEEIVRREIDVAREHVTHRTVDHESHPAPAPPPPTIERHHHDTIVREVHQHEAREVHTIERERELEVVREREIDRPAQLIREVARVLEVVRSAGVPPADAGASRAPARPATARTPSHQPPKTAALQAPIPPPLFRREVVQVEAPPAIHVTIGRVDVRAVTPSAPAPRASTPPPRPLMTLDEYLKQRERGSR